MWEWGGNEELRMKQPNWLNSSKCCISLCSGNPMHRQVFSTHRCGPFFTAALLVRKRKKWSKALSPFWIVKPLISLQRDLCDSSRCGCTLFSAAEVLSQRHNQPKMEPLWHSPLTDEKHFLQMDDMCGPMAYLKSAKVALIWPQPGIESICGREKGKRGASSLPWWLDSDMCV